MTRGSRRMWASLRVVIIKNKARNEVGVGREETVGCLKGRQQNKADALPKRKLAPQATE